MTIENPDKSPIHEEKNLLEKSLFEIAVRIDIPVTKWEQKWVDLALLVGYTREEIDSEAAKRRPKIIKQ